VSPAPELPRDCDTIAIGKNKFLLYAKRHVARSRPNTSPNPAMGPRSGEPRSAYE
jgi:hypothetical protein